VKALTRKLLRDLLLLKGQLVTIALVVACGVASYVSAVGTFRSLSGSCDRYYESQRMADVFATLDRAPESLARRLEEIPGVGSVYTRVVERASFPMEDRVEPATGIVVSLPTHGEPPLNGVLVRRGRMVDPARSDEILVSEPFANANHLGPGDVLPVVLDGRRHDMRIAGTAMSPEYVFVMSGAMMSNDDRRFGVFWMTRGALASAFRMENSFNDVVIRLHKGASERAVQASVDRLLEPYGGRGAVARDKQISNLMVQGELKQLRGLGLVVPAIFLAVAAFLLNVVLARLVELQRGQIAVLKALGYTGAAVGWHYLELIAVIVLAGSLLGVPLGAWVGQSWTAMYTPYFRFPDLGFRLDLDLVIVGVLVSVGAAAFGALRTVRSVARLPPAEAMSPPAPPTYGSSFVERLGLFRLVGAASRMILRDVLRQPLRTIMASVGIGMAMAVLVLGMFSSDVITHFMDVQFARGVCDDLNVQLARPVPFSELGALRTLPGVRRMEAERAVPVRFRHQHHVRDGALTGKTRDATLRRIVDVSGRVLPPPNRGVMLSQKLAEVLELSIGDLVDVEVLAGDRRKLRIPVTALVDDMMGLGATMDLDELSAALGEERTVSSVYLSLDPAEGAGAEARIAKIPAVIGTGRRADVVEAFRKQTAESMLLFSAILTVFAAIISIGVVYNTARVALSMRSRELASLRVLGFTRGEVSAILLGELAVSVVLAIPIGLPLGRVFAEAMMLGVDTEQFRMPILITARTYAYAVTIVVASAATSALFVRRQLDRLDLVGVLKTRE
jgi:putative ABC transport system permease protein